MINPENSIPCPVCGVKIYFEIKALLSGVNFVCTNCNSSIGISSESKPLVEDTVRKLEEVKKITSKHD